MPKLRMTQAFNNHRRYSNDGACLKGPRGSAADRRAPVATTAGIGRQLGAPVRVIQRRPQASHPWGMPRPMLRAKPAVMV